MVCGRCDNSSTVAALERVRILGDTLYFDTAHQHSGEINPPIFDRNIMAQVVQNEMIASVLGTKMAIDPANRPVRREGRPFTLVRPIAPGSTRGNSSEGIDVWGPGTGSPAQLPAGRTSTAPGTRR